MNFETQVSQTNPLRTLIRNAALILTMDSTIGAGELGVIEAADLLLVGDKIAAVGKHLREDGGQDRRCHRQDRHARVRGCT